MNYDEVMNIEKVTFGDMPPQPFLLGLLSAFDNRYQAAADAYFKEITWKQFFAIICINLCKEPPTLNELSDVMRPDGHRTLVQYTLESAKAEIEGIRHTQSNMYALLRDMKVEKDEVE